MTAPALLSIDVDAEWRKVSARSFRSPHHYPVEMVRSALARGAHRVEVRLTRTTVEVIDDGAGIGSRALVALRDLLDGEAPVHTRQEALREIEAPQARSLLASLSPSPSKMVVDSAGSGPQRHVEVTRTRAVTTGPTTRTLGSRVSLQRDGHALKREREILREFCRHSPDEIFLDGQRISHERIAANALGAIDLKPRGAVRWATVAIPREGDLCHFWQLTHGVRSKHWALEAKGGLLFEVVVECAAPLPDWLAIEATEAAREIYRELAASAHLRSTATQQRIEELLFLAYRRTHDDRLLTDYARFSLLTDGRRRTLEELRSMVDDGELFALREGERAERYEISDVPVLRLSQAQWELLAQHAGIRLSPPMPRPRPRPWPIRLWTRLRGGPGAIDRPRLGAAGPPIADDQLSPAERGLLDSVRTAVESGRFRPEGCPAGTPVQVNMCQRRRSRPTTVVHTPHPIRIALHRTHPTVRRAACALARQPEAIDLVLCALFDGQDGWSAAGHPALVTNHGTSNR